MWRPVERHFLIEIAGGRNLNRVIMMDWTGEGKQVDSLLQTRTFLRDDVVPMTDIERKTSVLKTSPMFPGKLLPIVDDIVITPGERDGYVREYLISFDVQQPHPHKSQKVPGALILETRTGVSDKTGQPVVSWLFVFIDGDKGLGRGGKPMYPVRYELALKILRAYERRLAFVNPSSEAGEARSHAFRVYEVP
jgi:hypothetical protein